MKTTELAALCNRYAERMEDPKFALAQSDEWDFRSVSRDELPDALVWEYARENRFLRKAAIQFLNSKVRGKTIRDRLLDGKLPAHEIWEIVNAGPWGNRLPPESAKFVWMLESIPLFPVPWLSMESEDRLEYCQELKRYSPRPVQISKWEDDLKMPPPLLKKRYLMRVDFAESKLADIVKAFERWARAESKRHVRSIKRGKGSQPEFQKLKWLAALRLHKAGLRYDSAEKFIREHVSKVVIRNTHDVLPVYSSPGAWHDAVKSAKREAQLYWPA